MVNIKILDSRYREWGMPAPATKGAAGIDLRASIEEKITLAPQQQKLIGVGIAIQPTEEEVAGLVVPRSGLGVKGLVLGNSVGLIDPDYTGEIQVPLLNRTDHEVFRINPGDRIAQLVLIRYIGYGINYVVELKETERGGAGFGSTG